MLIVLAMLAGPNLIPRVFSRVIPGFDEGVPCSWLPRANDRANHQSLLGRTAENPIALGVRATPITTNPADIMTVTMVVSNTSLGTVPFLFNPSQVIVGDNGTSGLGVIFTPSNSLSAGFRSGDPATFPESDIRLLAPRQSCVIRIEFPNGNILPDPALASGGSVKAYYRVTSSGQITQPANTLATPIYYDQGLWVGYVESEAVPLLHAGA
jgi:hypothetical protein